MNPDHDRKSEEEKEWAAPDMCCNRQIIDIWLFQFALFMYFLAGIAEAIFGHDLEKRLEWGALSLLIAVVVLKLRANYRRKPHLRPSAFFWW
jgi:hypothetical protein